MKAMVRCASAPDQYSWCRRADNRQVYAGVFPIDAGEFPKLEEAIERVSNPRPSIMNYR